jgi:hypothetical protein
MFRRLCSIVVVMTFLLAAPGGAKAFWPYWGYVYGFGNAWNLHPTTNYVPSPPYYAIYPPVYYSPHITARHYGASPFAWQPGMQPITYVPEPGQARAATVPAGTIPRGDLAEARVEPLRIDNPFVAGAKVAMISSVEPPPVTIHNPLVARATR